MPQLYNAAVITNAGIALLNRAQAGEVSIQFTRMAAGDGVYTQEEKTLSAMQGRIQLKSEKNSYPISSVGAASDNSVRLTAIITNQDPVTGETLVSDGYYINEMGLYAKEKDGEDSTEVLYSIVTVAAKNGDYMPPYNGHSPAQIVQEYHATVSNAAEVTIDCTGAALLVEDAEGLLKKATAPMKGATGTEDGTSGAVPAPEAGPADRFLGADGTWKGVPAQQSWGSGNVVGQTDSIAVGSGNKNHGQGYIACGDDNTVSDKTKAGVVAGYKNTVNAGRSVVTGIFNVLNSFGCIAFGDGNTTEGSFASCSMVGGRDSVVGSPCSAAIGDTVEMQAYSGLACGRHNAVRETISNDFEARGDAFVVGNGLGEYTGVEPTRSNAFRVSFSGDTYGLRAHNSSGADYAEFIKPWSDGNPDNEDRVGYFATIKDGYLHRADVGDYIVGITSGNPSIIGNADEDYYWKYERDVFDRIVLEGVPEIVVQVDGEGMPLLDEDGMPVLIDTGRTVKRMKLSESYDKTLQDTYVERKDRPEWDYVGMLGVLPVRDDGTCVPGQFCRCKDGGIATLATERDFDTYMVIERIAEGVVRVVLR